MSDYGNDDFEEFYENEKVLAEESQDYNGQQSDYNKFERQSLVQDEQIDYQTFETQSMTHRIATLNNRKKRASNDVQLLL